MDPSWATMVESVKNKTPQTKTEEIQGLAGRYWDVLFVKFHPFIGVACKNCK